MFGLSATVLFLTIVLVLAGGAAVSYALRQTHSSYRITPIEYGLCAVLIVVVITPTTAWAGNRLAQESAVGGYVEFWNGSITAARSQEIPCERDGSCWHEYDCDPYQELETYFETEYYTTTESYTDANGNPATRSVQASRQVPKTRWVTRYHSCPYATHEYSYWLEDSFGERHDIASHIYDDSPQEWRLGSGIPGNIPRGTPEQWVAAKANLDAGDADPVTKTNKYTNYLLASQNSLLQSYSDKVEKYQEAGLVPDHTRNLSDKPIYDGYKADKVVFVGEAEGALGNDPDWQQSLGRLNSYLGNELQGDLHVLIVKASIIDDPDDYTNALLAHWQSREYGKNGLAKNAIMLVIGANDSFTSVEWSRAKTGIPVGNGEMLSALSNSLKDEPLEPKSLLGWPTAKPVDDELSFSASDGVVEQVMLRDYAFKRPCMDCQDDGDHGSGYVYLKSGAFISTGKQIAIYAAVFILSMVAFYAAAIIGKPVFGSRPPLPYQPSDPYGSYHTRHHRRYSQP